jgi:type IV pilus assembly protein PilC
MFFTKRIPPKTLAILCRQLGTMLDSGIGLRKSILIATKKTMHTGTRSAMRDVADGVQEGRQIAECLREHGEFFPSLFIDMVEMSEQAGALPEVLLHLADHYENNERLKRELIQQITWPVIQLVAAILVIALLIYILGMVSSGEQDLSHLTFGLSGASGSATWLTMTFGSLAALVFGIKFVQKQERLKQTLDPFLMKVPVLGKCLRSFGVARFSWAYYLTQQTGMPVKDSIYASTMATANGAFTGRRDDILIRLMEGDTLTEALKSVALFPEEFIEMVSVAEESGTVPEALHRMSPQFEEEAHRSLQLLSRAVSGLVWLCVAGFIVMFIFKVAMWYVGMLNDAGNEAM